MSVKSTVEQLSPTRVRISVEVPFEELKPEFDKAYKALAGQVRVPGFRPGKVPARILEARVGRGAVLEQVVNEAIPSRYSEAVDAAKIKAVGKPEVELTKIEDNESFSFTAEVDVRPEITLPAFETLAVAVEDVVAVTDADVEEQLESLRARFATTVPVDRGVENGDLVTLDLSATVDGEDVEEAKAEGLSHEVGSGTLVEGLDDAVLGLVAGGTAEFTTTLVAGSHAGKDAVVSVTVGTVKVRELPEVDDEFAELASEFSTVDELKDDLRTRAEQVKKVRFASAVRDKVIEQLLETVEIPVPDALVQAQVDEQLHDAIHALDHDEDKLNELLEGQGKSREEFNADSRAAAEKLVRTQFLLDAIADAVEVSVGQEELFERIMFQAQRYGMEPQQFIAEIQQQPNGIAAIFADARRTKALGEVIARVSVTDGEGNAVDTAELLGRTDDEAEVGADLDAGADAEVEDAGTDEAAAEVEEPADKG